MSTSEKHLHPQLSVNDILRHYPTAVRVLSAYHIDSCCRGNQSLATAASDLGLDPNRGVTDIVANEDADAELPARCSCGHVYDK
jgi:iron-sulfur cluster repair protein YtfE (RIC family)